MKSRILLLPVLAVISVFLREPLMKTSLFRCCVESNLFLSKLLQYPIRIPAFFWISCINAKMQMHRKLPSCPFFSITAVSHIAKQFACFNFIALFNICIIRIMNLPAEFIEKMKNLLGDEFDDYISCYQEPNSPSAFWKPSFVYDYPVGHTDNRI